MANSQSAVSTSSPALSRTATIALAATAIAAGTAALAWWALSDAPSTSVQRKPFDWNKDEVPEVSDADLAMLSEYTGCKDLQALRKRLLRWWHSVKRRVHVYRCIQEMMFLQPRINRHKAYKALLYQAAKPSALTSLRVADVGCCFGQDTRRMLLDGVPAPCIWAMDLVEDYWEAAKGLWEDGSSDSRLAGVNTLFGDMSAVPRTPSAINLEKKQLLGTFHFVTAMAVLHCLPRDKCDRFLSRCLSMLEPGRGVFFGYCVGSSEPEGVTWAALPDPKAMDRELHTRFLHSAATLQQTMETLGYTDVEVSVMEQSISSAHAGKGAKEGVKPSGGAPKMLLLGFMGKRPKQ